MRSAGARIAIFARPTILWERLLIGYENHFIAHRRIFRSANSERRRGED